MSLNWAGWRVAFVAVLIHDEIQGQLVTGGGAWVVYGARLLRTTGDRAAPMRNGGRVGSPGIALRRRVSAPERTRRDNNRPRDDSSDENGVIYLT